MRGLFWRATGLTLALFVALFIGMEWLIAALPALGFEWVNWALAAVAPVVVVLLFVVLGAPVAALFIGVFLEEAAARVEAADFPGDPPARGAPFFVSLRVGIAFALAALALNLVLLPLHVFLPLIGTGVAILANGSLIGREYFLAVALRHESLSAARRRRRANGFTAFGAGIAVAALSAVPFVSLIAPLFGVTLMVYVFKEIARDA